MKDSETVYIKENIITLIIGFICNGGIGALVIFFVISTWDILEIKQLSDIFSLLAFGETFLFILGCISCSGALSYFINLINRPYIKLSKQDISGNAIKKTLMWSEITDIKIVELPKWYFRFLKACIAFQGSRGVVGAGNRLNDINQNEEELSKTTAKVCIINKSGNKIFISLENGYSIRNKIINYMKDNDITL